MESRDYMWMVNGLSPGTLYLGSLHQQKKMSVIRLLKNCSCGVKKEKQLDTISLRATSRSSVRLAPKIPNYIVHVFDYDKIRSLKSIHRF